MTAEGVLSGGPLGEQRWRVFCSLRQVALPNLNKGSGKGGAPMMEVDTLRGEHPEIASDWWPSPAAPDGATSWVSCSVCHRWTRSFKFMLSEKVYDDAGSEAYTWFRRCMICLSKDKNISMGDSYMQIAQQRTRWDRERSKTFQENKEKLVQDFSFTGSNRQLKLLSRSKLTELFRPWASFIRAKVEQIELSTGLLEQLGNCMGKVSQLITKVASGGKAGMAEHESELNTLLQQSQELESKVLEAGKRMAFKSKGDPALINSFQMASEFQDSWIETSAGRFRSWYVCSCGAATSSKAWKRRHSDHAATKQRYYCICCARKYRTTMGQIVEVEMGGLTMWSRAEIPPDSLEDIRGLASEARGVPNCPKEWFEALTQFTPTTGTIFRRAEMTDLYDPGAADAPALLGSFAMLTPSGKAVLDARPMFPWNQLLTLF